jgi:hypothetical protein
MMKWKLIGQCLTGVVSLCALEMAVRAQAFEAPPNTVSATVAGSKTYTKGFYSFCGEEYERCFDAFTYELTTITMGAEYWTPLEGLAVYGALPIMDPEVTGDDPLVSGGVLGMDINDEGFQATDLTIGARYVLPWKPNEFRIAPSFTYLTPVGYDVSYAFHATYGKHLDNYSFGIDVGRVFLDQAYFDVNYTYTISEAVDEMDGLAPKPNRSDASLALGYFINNHLSIQGQVLTRYTHGGWSWAQYATWDIDPANWTERQLTKDLNHDAYAREKTVTLRATPAYDINEYFGVFIDAYKQVRGASVSAAWSAGIGVRGTYGF